MSRRKDKTLGLVKTIRSASKTMSSVAAATKRPRPKRRLRDVKDAKPCTATKSTGELFEGVFLPLSIGGRPRNLERVQMAAPLKIVDSEQLIKLKYEGAAGEPWDRLDDTDEWSIKAQLLLREDYLARLRKMSLPLATGPSQDPDEIDEDNFVQLADLLRNVTVSAVNNICDANLEKGSGSSKSRREPFLWNGRNILLELPSDLDFAARLPRLREILGVDSLHRNPFLERKSLPLPDTAEGREILRPLLDMEPESPIQRARRAILEEEHRHGVRRVKGPFGKWKELEELREQVKIKGQEDEMLSREMMPKLAKVTVCQHNVHCFRRQDADGDGLLTYKEFLRGLKLLLLPFSIDSHEQFNWILEQVDPQRAGCVSYTAFNMLCENAKKFYSKRRTRWRRLTNNESEPPATTEEQKDAAEKVVLEKVERDNNKEADFHDEKMEEKQGDEPAWLVEYNGVARKLARTRRRIQTLLDDRLHLETEFKGFHAQTPSSPRVAKTAYFEYSESNAKRHEAILQSLQDSIREADSAIGCLREQELALVASLRVLKEQAMRNREILRNQREELEMARQEKRERDMCNEEAKRKRAEERARIKAEEAKYRTEQRDLRRKALREKLRQEHSAATLIANSFRSWQARLRLAWFAESADEALCDIRSSQLFDMREKRLLERPTPLLVLGVGSRGKNVESFLRRSMPGNFWAFIPPVDAPDVANIGEVMQWWLDRAAALYWELPHNLTQDIAAALLITLETVRPRPLVIYLGDSGRHGDPHARWIFGALRHVNASALDSSGEPLTTASIQALEDATAQILPSEDLQSADDLVPTEKKKNGQQAPNCAEVNLLASVVRACKKSTNGPQRTQRNRFTAEFVNQNVSWPQVRFIDNTAAAAVRAFVETSAGISTPSLLRELIDVNLSDKSDRDCEDMILHFALRELRVFQGATAMDDDMGTTLFRYGSRQVLVRTVPRGDHAVYRILDARGLAIRLAHSSGTLRSRLERMRAGKRERTLCNITSMGNESRGSRSVGETVVRLHAASRLIENVDGSLVLYKGCPGGYVCWLHWSETKPGRAQVKMVSSIPPFRELRGTISADMAKSGDEIRRYLLHAVGRLRANSLTGLVSLAQ